ncbi:hypothetical protein [Nocardioides sp.]|uniref:hypothetical protein n=1 Tax=Nocardioides sp. TaxID=35761 RepID=UPI0027355F8E|nr:hypothetical protein [Nocardioides sp.]MDP3892632.1 hypothetical protein [Nocardioides sp.]
MPTPPPLPRRVGAALLGAALLAGPTSGCSLFETSGGQQALAEVAEVSRDSHAHTHGEDGVHVSMPVGDGTSSYEVGYTLAQVRLPALAGEPGELSFRIDDFEGAPHTDFLVEQTRPMHVYVVSEDLAVFRHVHPEPTEDGRWTTRLTLPEPGRYRVVAEFVARDPGGNGDHVILGEQLHVGGHPSDGAVPAAATPVDPTRNRTAVDVSLEGGEGRVGGDQQLTAVVTDLQGDPVRLDAYLGTHAHLTGFHTESGSMVHLHPLGTPEIRKDGTRLAFHTTFEQPGGYRLFVQVRVDGYLHTVPVDLSVS